MNVPNGFKQTEVGVIPKDWEAVSFSDVIISTQLGGNYQANSIDNGFPLIKMGNLGRGNIVLSKIEFIALPINISERDRLEYGDVLFNTRNTLELVGKVAIWRNDLPIAYFNSNIMRICFDSRKIGSNFFINYILNSTGLVSQLKSIAIGTTSVAAIYSRDLFKIKIPLPSSKAEQTVIAAALSDMDALIEGVEKLLEKKRRIKQGAMQELLRPKEGWKEVLLGSIADIITGFPFPSSGYSDDGIKLLRGSNVKRGSLDWSKDNTKYWKNITNDIKVYELQAGDVVIAMDGSLVGKSFAQVSDHDLPALLLQRVARIRTYKVDMNYISHLVCGNYFTIHCEQIKTSSAIPHISPKDINDFQISLPPTRAEQATIAAILSDMDAEIEQLETQLTKYRQLKTGMMQELLTGKKRLL